MRNIEEIFFMLRNGSSSRFQEKCVNKIGGFDCVCPAGFTGPACELDLNECESNPCHPSSTCINLSSTYAQCGKTKKNGQNSKKFGFSGQKH